MSFKWFKRMMLAAVLLGLSFVLAGCLGFVPQPVASFEAPSEATVGKEVELNASATTDADIYEWDFGDGNVGKGRIVKHAYLQAGEYYICLTARNTSGFVEKADWDCDRPITVAEPGPPPPNPCDKQPVAGISPSSGSYEPGDTVVLSLTAYEQTVAHTGNYDPTGVDRIQLIITPPAGSGLDTIYYRSDTGPTIPSSGEIPLQLSASGLWTVLLKVRAFCDNQDKVARATASFLVQGETPPPCPCEAPTYRITPIPGDVEVGEIVAFSVVLSGEDWARLVIKFPDKPDRVFESPDIPDSYEFVADTEGTYQIRGLATKDCEPREERAEFSHSFYANENEPPSPPPEEPEYELTVRNLTRPSGPDYTCHRIEAKIRIVSGEAETPMQIRWGDGDESPGMTGLHQYHEANGFVIQALDNAGKVVDEETILIQLPDCVTPELEILSAPDETAYVGDSFTISISGSDADQESTFCLCSCLDCLLGHGIYRVHISAFDPDYTPLPEMSKNLEGAEVAFPVSVSGVFSEAGTYTFIIYLGDDDEFCCPCACAHYVSVTLEVEVIERP